MPSRAHRRATAGLASQARCSSSPRDRRRRLVASIHVRRHCIRCRPGRLSASPRSCGCCVAMLPRRPSRPLDHARHLRYLKLPHRPFPRCPGAPQRDPPRIYTPRQAQIFFHCRQINAALARHRRPARIFNSPTASDTFSHSLRNCRATVRASRGSRATRQARCRHPDHSTPKPRDYFTHRSFSSLPPQPLSERRPTSHSHDSVRRSAGSGTPHRPLVVAHGAPPRRRRLRQLAGPAARATASQPNGCFPRLPCLVFFPAAAKVALAGRQPAANMPARAAVAHQWHGRQQRRLRPRRLRPPVPARQHAIAYTHGLRQSLWSSAVRAATLSRSAFAQYWLLKRHACSVRA